MNYKQKPYLNLVSYPYECYSNRDKQYLTSLTAPISARGLAMTKKVLNQPTIADPAIETVLRDFIKDPDAGKSLSKLDKKGAIELFRSSMNEYGHQWLSEEDEKIFEHYYNLEGKKHKEFSQIFGPEKIIDSVGEFVGYYLIRKVMLEADEMTIAAKAVAELCKWLKEKELVPQEAIQEAIERAERATEDLPRAEDANRLIWQQSEKCPQSPIETYVDFGHMRISRILNNSLWLESDEGETIGPVSISAKAAQLLKPDWTINCALLKSRGKWYFCEVGNVYPD